MDPKRQALWWRAGIVVLLLAALAWWISLNFEWRTEEINIGPTEEARRNPFLALQMLIQGRDKQTHLKHGFHGLDRLTLGDQQIGQYDAVVLIHTFQSLQEPQVDALWGWVQDGGTLIVAAYNPHIPSSAYVQDNLLQRMGLILQTDNHVDLVDSHPRDEADTDAPPTQAEDSEQSDAITDCRVGTEVTAEWPEETTSLRIRTDRSTHLYLDDSEAKMLASTGENLTAIAEYALGEGRIYTFAHDFPLRNRHIACGDNGYVLWKMVAQSPTVWFALNANSPSFWDELWRLSPAGCVALFLTLVLWVWQHGTRFGPVHMVDRSQRRHFIDHIRASATFLLRNQDNAPLIQTLRDDIQQRMRLHHSGFDQLPIDKQLAKLQQMTALPREELHLAMFHPLPLPAGHFLEAVKRLQHLRNNL